MENIVETENLSKIFNNKYAVNNVNMKIKQGDIYGLIGKNGAGKTTFMPMLCALASPSYDTIKLFGGEDLHAARRKMGCTIENPALYPYMTAMENLEVYRLMLQIENKDIKKELLRIVNLDPYDKKKAKDFSLGMKQRLMIAIALLGQPQLLILDEPMNGLDPTGIKEMRDLLLYLNHERKLTIVVSSHILDELFKIANRYGVIHDGKMVAEFSQAEMEERCLKKITLKVDDLDKTFALLQEQNIQFEVHDQKDIVILDHLDHIAMIHQKLFENGVHLYASIPGEQSLEEYFMNIIGGKEE